MASVTAGPTAGGPTAAAPVAAPCVAVGPTAAAGNGRRTVLCSVGVGPHATLLELAQPSFERLAGAHGWDVQLHFRPLQHERPPAWNKVVAIRRLLATHDTVVWIDADAVVVDPVPDVTDVAGPERFLWLTRHHYDGEDQPNTGVLVVHAGDQAARFLDATWEATHLVEHPWWEQAAMLHLLGFDVTDFGHARLAAPTPWLEGVGWLDHRWNSIPQDCHPSPCVRHYAGLSQAERLAFMSRDLRQLLGPPPKADPATRVSVVLPLRDAGPEKALLSLASVAASELDLQLVLVDDGADLHGVAAATGGDVAVVRNPGRSGLAASWDAGLQAATGEVVVLLADAVRLWPGCLDALAGELSAGAVVATATAPHDARLPGFRSPVLAAAAAELRAAEVPLGARDGDVAGELCARLGAGGRSVVTAVSAVAEDPAGLPGLEPPVGLAQWALRMLRSRYALDVAHVPARQELPWLLQARGLLGVGAEIGVQEGLFSRHLLAHWGGRRLLSVDSWEHEAGGDYVDVANVGQAEQDARYRRTCQRLAVFGDRSEVWRLRSTEAAERLADASLDFVYIDARHDYPAVLEDLAAWVPKVRPGGIVAGHDYLDGDLPEGRFGVKSAVDEFFAARGARVAATRLDPPWLTWLVEVPAGGWGLGGQTAAAALAEEVAEEVAEVVAESA